MVELGAMQDGFLGIESARGADGLGITVSYWRDEAAIVAWKRNAEHQRAQAGGKSAWYAEYHVRIAKVERAYGTDEVCTADRGARLRLVGGWVGVGNAVSPTYHCQETRR